MKKHFWGMVSCVCLVLCLTGCSYGLAADNPGQTDGGKTVDISVSWWGRDVRHSYMKQGLEKFMEQNPGISVRSSFSEWDGYETAFDMRMEAEEEADVMFITHNWLRRYSVDGYGFYDLEKLSDEIDTIGFTRDELELGRNSTVINAIPISMSTQTPFYNTVQYEKYGAVPPDSWDDLFTAAMKMRGYCYPLALSETSMWYACIAHEEQQCGSPILGRDGRLIFTRDNVMGMLDFAVRLIEEDVTPLPHQYDPGNVKNGKYAGWMCWNGDVSSEVTPLLKSDGIIAGKQPQVSGSKRYGWYIKPTALLAVSSHARNPGEAAKLVSYLLNDPEMAALRGMDMGMPLSEYAQAAVKGNEGTVEYEACEQMNLMLGKLQKHIPKLESAEMIREFTEAYTKIYYGDRTMEEAGEELYMKMRINWIR